MKEKPNSVLVKINDIKNVVASAENYSPRRMEIVFSNSEYRLKDIPGINPSYFNDLEEITNDCMKLMPTDQKQCFELYNSKLGDLLAKVLNDMTTVLVPSS